MSDVDWSGVQSLEAWEQVVRERFPGYAWALDHEELGPILKEAAEGEFTATTFESRLRATDWFASRSAAERTWDAFIADPANEAEVARQVEEQVGELRREAGVLGAELSDEQLDELARVALRRELSPAEITAQIVGATDSYAPGAFMANETTINEYASNYLVSVDEETRRSLAGKFATGQIDQSGIESYFQSIAKSQHPQFADLIDRGISVKEYMAPQRNMIAEMLGRSPADIDLMSPEFSAVTRIGDGGNLRAMNLTETAQFVRSSDDYWSTSKGRREVNGMVNGLTRALGVRR